MYIQKFTHPIFMQSYYPNRCSPISYTSHPLILTVYSIGFFTVNSNTTSLCSYSHNADDVITTDLNCWMFSCFVSPLHNLSVIVMFVIEEI